MATKTPVKKTPASKAKKAAPSIAVKVPKKTAHDPSARVRKVSKYKSFRLQKRIPHPAGPIPSSWRLLGKTRRLLWANKKPLLVLFIIYTVLSLVLVRNFTSPLNVADVKNTMSRAFGLQADNATTTSTIAGLLLGGSADPTSDASSLYQTLLLIIVSLALIWIFRQYAAGNKPTAKMALYRGLYPLVPFLLVIVVIAIQIIPAVVGGAVFSTVTQNSLAVTGVEQMLWLLFFVMLIILSVYMICSSLFALYIVTLPGMTPMKALRTARQLVLSRRLNIIRKILVLPILMFIFLIIIVVPAIYFAGIAAPWLYFVLTLLSVVILHAYLFTIYRELL